jgi:hypothetical protein
VQNKVAFEDGGAANALLMHPLKLRSGWRAPFAVWVSSVLNISNAELYLLLSEHRGFFAGNGGDLLVVVHVVMLAVLVMTMMSLPLVMMLVIFGF